MTCAVRHARPPDHPAKRSDTDEMTLTDHIRELTIGLDVWHELHRQRASSVERPTSSVECGTRASRACSNYIKSVLGPCRPHTSASSTTPFALISSNINDLQDYSWKQLALPVHPNSTNGKSGSHPAASPLASSSILRPQQPSFGLIGHLDFSWKQSTLPVRPNFIDRSFGANPAASPSASSAASFVLNGSVDFYGSSSRCRYVRLPWITTPQ